MEENEEIDNSPETEDENSIDTLTRPQNWKNAKSQMTKYLTNKGKLKTAVSSYTKALGGAKKAGMSSASGKVATINLGGFFSGVSNLGIRDTLKDRGIEFENREVHEVLSDVINILSPIPDSKENSIARNAMIKTIEKLYTEIEEIGGDLGALDKLTPEYFDSLLGSFISDFIYERLMNDLASRIETSNQDVETIINLEKDLQLYVKGNVESVLKNKDIISNDFSSTKTKGVIEKLYIECYEVLEEAL